MKIRMLEHFQGRGLPSLAYGEEHEVPGKVSEQLAAWLLEHRKAEVVDEPKHYGSQPLTDEPELRQDEELYAEVKQEADATDAALKLAQENNIDLAQIEGTGSGGRVILSDVQSYLEAEGGADEPQE